MNESDKNTALIRNLMLFIKELIVPLPSIEEQMRIVKRLNETLPLVEVNLEGDE